MPLPRRDTITCSRFLTRWGSLMAAVILGVVREGKIVPDATLPEGLQVQITVPEEVVIPEELQSELEAWSQGNAEALAMVEHAAEEMGRGEKG
jgi:hypothetical protein